MLSLRFSQRAVEQVGGVTSQHRRRSLAALARSDVGLTTLVITIIRGTTGATRAHKVPRATRVTAPRNESADLRCYERDREDAIQPGEVGFVDERVMSQLGAAIVTSDKVGFPSHASQSLSHVSEKLVRGCGEIRRASWGVGCCAEQLFDLEQLLRLPVLPKRSILTLMGICGEPTAQLEKPAALA